MKYISTRGGCVPQNFEQVLLTGLAPDGGLFVPENLPKFSIGEMEEMQSLDYSDLVIKIISPFVDGEIPDSDLREIVRELPWPNSGV